MILGFTPADLEGIKTLDEEEEIPHYLKVFLPMMLKPMRSVDPGFAQRLSKHQLMRIVQEVIFESSDLMAQDVIQLAITRALVLNDILKKGVRRG